MMGRQSGQMSMIILDLSALIPENHLLRKINQMISFDFIYDLVAPYYPTNGRPSVDPVSMFKMLLVGYLYGVKSERRLVQEVQLNIAYRWFCGFELTDKIPDHSTLKIAVESILLLLRFLFCQQVPYLPLSVFQFGKLSAYRKTVFGVSF